MQFFIRHWRGIIGFVCVWIAIPVVGEFAIEIARDLGFYKHPAERLGFAMSILLAIADYPGFKLTVAAIVGLFAGIWLDSLVRGRRRMDIGGALILAALILGVAGLIMREVKSGHGQSLTVAAAQSDAYHFNTPPESKEGQKKVTARLRLHYTENPVTSEVIQNDNVATRYTFAFLGDGATANPADHHNIKWSTLVIVFDQPLTVSNVRVRFESGGSLIYSITKIEPRLGIIRFEGSLADRVIDIEVYG